MLYKRIDEKNIDLHLNALRSARRIDWHSDFNVNKTNTKVPMTS